MEEDLTLELKMIQSEEGKELNGEFEIQLTVGVCGSVCVYKPKTTTQGQTN